MKKLLLMAGFALLAASCSHDESLDSSVNLSNAKALAPVTVRVSDFSMTQEDFPATRATQAAADYSDVKALTLAFYQGSTEVYKVTQLKDDTSTFTTFGEFSLSLPFGSYTMVVLGYYLSTNEPAITLTSPTTATFGDYPARETFVATNTVNVTNSNALDISATLNRIVSKLQVVSSDVRTAGATKVRMSFAAGGKSFNPTTGLATSDGGFSNAVTISTNVGAISRSNTFLFLASNVQNMDVTIQTLDADDNVLFSKTVQNVPFQRNRVTKLTGAIYTNSSVSGAFQLETNWADQYEGTF